MVMPRLFSSSRRSASMPVSARTKAVLPWSICPAVPAIIFFMALLLMLLLGSGLLAQEKPAKEEPMTIFPAEVSLVKVDFELVERNSTAPPAFTKDDFVVFDENQPQPIVHLERQSVPLDLLLLLDISGSMRRSLEDVAAASRAALAQLQPGDRVALMLFSRRAEAVQPFTQDFGSTQYKI